MSDFGDQYEKQIKENIGWIHDALFPPKTMKWFEETSAKMIADGLNDCFPCSLRGKTTKTMTRIFGIGHPAHAAWMCASCSNEMWSKGRLHGTVGFDMTK